MDPLLHPRSVLGPVGSRFVAVDGRENSKGAVLKDSGGFLLGGHGCGDVVEVGGGSLQTSVESDDIGSEVPDLERPEF